MSYCGSFLEFRETAWTSADGKTSYVKNLQDSHVVNILNWIKDQQYQYPAGLYELFEEEAAYRKVIAFAQGNALPVKVDGRWMLMHEEMENG